MWLLRLKLGYSYTSGTLPTELSPRPTIPDVCLPEVSPWCPSSKAYLVLGDGLVGLEFTKQAKLGDQRALGVCLSLPVSLLLVLKAFSTIFVFVLM